MIANAGSEDLHTGKKIYPPALFVSVVYVTSCYFCSLLQLFKLQ